MPPPDLPIDREPIFDDDDESGMANDPLAMTERREFCERWTHEDYPGIRINTGKCGGAIKRERDGIRRCERCRYGYGS